VDVYKNCFDCSLLAHKRVKFLFRILSLQGGHNQICWDEQFDVKIIPIRSADLLAGNCMP
jgi:hypothetical protein